MGMFVLTDDLVNPTADELLQTAIQNIEIYRDYRKINPDSVPPFYLLESFSIKMIQQAIEREKNESK